MAITPDYYVDINATGDDSGDSWVNGAPSINTNDASYAAGDIVWVASDHTETGTNLLTATLVASMTNPITFVSVNSTTGAYEEGAELTNTSGLLLGGTSGNDKGFVLRGFTLGVCSSTNGDFSLTSDTNCALIDCTIVWGSGANTNSEIILSESSRIENLTIDASADTSAGDLLQPATGTVIKGITMVGGATKADFIKVGSNYAPLDGVDMSSMTLVAGVDFMSGARAAQANGNQEVVSNIKWPSTIDFPGVSVSHPTDRYTAINCTSGAHNHGLLSVMRAGTVVDSQTKTLTGIIDGTASSFLMTTNANCTLACPLQFELPELWTTANKTFTWNFTSDVVLDPGNFYIFYGHPTSGSPQLRTWVSTQDPGAFDNSTTGSFTTVTPGWSPSGSTYIYELSYTVSGGAEGMHAATVVCSKASAAIYIDPEPALS